MPKRSHTGRSSPPSPANSDQTWPSEYSNTEQVAAVEIAAAVDFLAKYLTSPQSQLTQAQSSDLLSVLPRHLALLIASTTWHPAFPTKGSARRCILNTSTKLDPVLRECALATSIPPALLLASLPQDLVLWIDPGTVSSRMGNDHGPIVCVYEDPVLTQIREAEQQQIKEQWQHNQMHHQSSMSSLYNSNSNMSIPYNNTNTGASPPIMGGYSSPPVSRHSSPLIGGQQFVGGAFVSLPQKTRVIIKSPSSIGGNGPVFVN